MVTANHVEYAVVFLPVVKPMWSLSFRGYGICGLDLVSMCALSLKRLSGEVQKEGSVGDVVCEVSDDVGRS